jgi:ribosomal protein S27E
MPRIKDSTVTSDATSHTPATPTRYRCDGCGNVTRFDVVATAKTRRFAHYNLAGDVTIEEETVLDETVESVTCHWCGRSDAISTEHGPSGGV